jgi:DNA (cytosine-5)-methyltransferase 1
VLNARDYGLPQNRERVFVVADRGGGHFVFPPRQRLGLRLKDMLESEVAEKYYISEGTLAGILSSRFVAQRTRLQDPGGIHRALCARDGAYAGAVTANSGSSTAGGAIAEPVPCALRGRNPNDPGDRAKGMPTEQRLEYGRDGVCNAITTVQKDSLIAEGAIVGSMRANAAAMGEGGGYVPMHGFQGRARRLTPRECWRLMGFTDGQFDRAKGMSDAQLYRQAGNGMAVKTLEAIFRRMLLEGGAGMARANTENQYEFALD